MRNVIKFKADEKNSCELAEDKVLLPLIHLMDQVVASRSWWIANRQNLKMMMIGYNLKMMVGYNLKMMRPIQWWDRWSEYERAAFWPRFAQKDDWRYLQNANVKIF